MDINKWIAVGKVQGMPAITERDGKKQASLTLIVNRRIQQQNGQWVDTPIKVPVFAFDKKAELVEKYIVDGQELGIECFYQSWGLGNGQLGHGMMLENVSFGFKPKKDVTEQAGGMQNFPQM